MQLFVSKADVVHVAKTINNSEIAKNNYNLLVSSFIEAKDNRERVDISQLNAEISQPMAEKYRLRADIDTIVKEIEA